MTRAGALLWWLAACSPATELLPPSGHVLLQVDTDAPVLPLPGTALEADAPAPLFDRLLIEIFRFSESQPCAGCVAELDLNRDVLLRGGSFAVVPSGPTSGLRVRLRMFLDARRNEGWPAPEATVEVVIALPPVPAEGVIEVSVFLPTEAVGFPLGSLEEPTAAVLGSPSGSRVGSWLPAQRVGCAGEPPAGAVCVPGGAFFMGHPRAVGEPAALFPAGSGGLSEAARQRLVVLSPFFLDVREVTVADIRASGAVFPSQFLPWSGGNTGAVPEDFCAYPTEPDPEREQLPMGCISWRGARQYCQVRGGDLPTEAQLEYVAGALESRFRAWGSDTPDCDDTVWSRMTVPQLLECTQGLAPGNIGGSVALPSDIDPNAPPPPRTRDRVALPGGVLFDLIGNQAEWARDYHQEQDEPCWTKSDSNVFVNPLCDTPSARGEKRTVRAGSWADSGEQALAAPARRILPYETGTNVGFRCAYPAMPTEP